VTDRQKQIDNFVEPDKAKWRALMREMEPDMTDEEFERDWAELTEMRKGATH